MSHQALRSMCFSLQILKSFPWVFTVHTLTSAPAEFHMHTSAVTQCQLWLVLKGGDNDFFPVSVLDMGL